MDDENELAEMLGTDFEGLEKLGNYGIKDVSKLATEYLKTQEHISSSVRAPNENASAEEWARFYKRLGAPDEPDGYETPELSTDFKSIVDTLKPTAKELGLTTKQFNALVKSADQAQAKRLEAIREKINGQNEKWIEEAKQKYGGEFEKNVANAQRALQELIDGDSEVGEILNATGLGSHPALIELLAKAQRASGEHTMADSEDAGAGTPDPLDAARGKAMRIREITQDPNFTNRKTVEYTKLQEEYYRLQKELAESGFKGAMDPKLQLDKPGVGHYPNINFK